jgi:hypothetical protein
MRLKAADSRSFRASIWRSDSRASSLMIRSRASSTLAFGLTAEGCHRVAQR